MAPLLQILHQYLEFFFVCIVIEFFFGKGLWVVWHQVTSMPKYIPNRKLRGICLNFEGLFQYGKRGTGAEHNVVFNFSKCCCTYAFHMSFSWLYKWCNERASCEKWEKNSLYKLMPPIKLLSICALASTGHWDRSYTREGSGWTPIRSTINPKYWTNVYSK